MPASRTTFSPSSGLVRERRGQVVQVASRSELSLDRHAPTGGARRAGRVEHPALQGVLVLVAPLEAARVEELDAVVRLGVVARGDHHAGGGAERLGQPGHAGRGDHPGVAHAHAARCRAPGRASRRSPACSRGCRRRGPPRAGCRSPAPGAWRRAPRRARSRSARSRGNSPKWPRMPSVPKRRGGFTSGSSVCAGRAPLRVWFGFGGLDRDPHGDPGGLHDLDQGVGRHHRHALPRTWRSARSRLTGRVRSTSVLATSDSGPVTSTWFGKTSGSSTMAPAAASPSRSGTTRMRRLISRSTSTGSACWARSETTSRPSGVRTLSGPRLTVTGPCLAGRARPGRPPGRDRARGRACCCRAPAPSRSAPGRARCSPSARCS